MSAFYELFASPDALTNQFQTDVSVKHPHPVPCPEGQPSPGSWHYDSSPNKPAGSVLCGSVEGGDDFAIEWTRDSGPLLALADGPDLTSMYDWWTTNR